MLTYTELVCAPYPYNPYSDSNYVNKYISLNVDMYSMLLVTLLQWHVQFWLMSEGNFLLLTSTHPWFSY